MNTPMAGRAAAWSGHRAGTVCAVLAALALGLTGSNGPAIRLQAAARSPFKAVAFDSFVLFNPDSIVSDADAIFPGQGRELATVWRTRQFEYSWLRSISGRYVDFFAVTEDALVYAAHTMKLEPTAEQKQRLLDAEDGLRRLRQAGIRVMTIANFSPAMLRANTDRAGMAGLFELLVSTDANHTYKPDPRAYRLGIDRLHLQKREIVFAAFGGWDAAGAKAFGYPTVWVNRFNQPLEELGVRPDRTVANLEGLLDFVLDASPSR